jgi:hypothetical protein
MRKIGMATIERLGSVLNPKNLAFESHDSVYTKFGKVAAGVGVAGLALISWKFIFVGAVGYSAYKGTQYLQNRFLQPAKPEAARGPVAAAADEVLHHAPIDAGHDAHNHQQRPPQENTKFERLKSYLNPTNLAFKSQDSAYTKLGKVAAGIGVAGLALLSWKFIVVGGVGYSTYKGTQYLQNRFLQPARREAAAGPVPAADEAPHDAPVDAGHEAHDDQQGQPQPIHAGQVENDTVPRLRQMQAGLPGWHARRALQAIITHPRVEERGNDLQWIKKLVLKHGKWSKRTLGLSLPVVIAFRKIKACFPKEQALQDNPVAVANQ